MYTKLYSMLVIINIAGPKNTFRFQSSDVTVPENQTEVDVCVVFISQGPLLQSISLQLTFMDGTG